MLLRRLSLPLDNLPVDNLPVDDLPVAFLPVVPVTRLAALTDLAAVFSLPPLALLDFFGSVRPFMKSIAGVRGSLAWSCTHAWLELGLGLGLGLVRVRVGVVLHPRLLEHQYRAELGAGGGGGHGLRAMHAR